MMKTTRLDISNVIAVVKPQGNGAHINLPKSWIGKTVRCTVVDDNANDAVVSNNIDTSQPFQQYQQDQLTKRKQEQDHLIKQASRAALSAY